MSRQETRLRRHADAIWTLSYDGAGVAIRHLRSAREQTRATGEICGCNICQQRLGGIGTHIKEKAPVETDGILPGDRTDEEEPNPLPRSPRERNFYQTNL